MARWIGVAVGVLGLAATAIAGCAAGSDGAIRKDVDDRPPAEDETVDEAPVTPTGAELYASRCASCHGASAEGNTVGPQIRFPVEPYAEHVIRLGFNEMPEFGEMPAYEPDEIDPAGMASILEHLRSFPRPTDGAGLYLALCGNCHGAAGEGGRFDDSIVGAERGEILELVRGGEGSGFADEDYMPSWTDAELSPEELEKISLFLRASDDGEEDDGEEDDGEEDDGEEDDGEEDDGEEEEER